MLHVQCSFTSNIATEGFDRLNDVAPEWETKPTKWCKFGIQSAILACLWRVGPLNENQLGSRTVRNGPADNMSLSEFRFKRHVTFAFVN